MYKFVVTALALLILAAPAAAADVDKLIDQNIEAMGGQKTLDSVKTMSVEGAIVQMGMEIPFVMTQKRPDKMKIEATMMGMTMVQCFAGGEGWATNPMTGGTEPVPMSEEEAKSFALQADIEGPLMNYKDKGYTVTSIGEGDVKGTPVEKIRLDTGDGVTMDMSLDKETHLVIMQESKMDMQGQEVVTNTYLTEYTDVEGVKIPFRVETYMGEQLVNTLVFKSVKINEDVDDSVFAKPAAAAAE